jgi:hypothetical protein
MCRSNVLEILRIDQYQHFEFKQVCQIDEKEIADGESNGKVTFFQDKIIVFGDDWIIRIKDDYSGIERSININPDIPEEKMRCSMICEGRYLICFRTSEVMG